MNSHFEAYSSKQSLIKIANQKYKQAENEKMVEQIADLEKTLEINKTLVNQLVSEDIKES